MDAELLEGRLNDIRCEYSVTRPEAALMGSYDRFEDPAAAPPKGTCFYQLYIPPGYNRNAEWKYPVMFIASAKGAPITDNVEARARRDGWILVLLMDSVEGDPLWLANFLGAHDDVVKRVRALPDFKVATGSKAGGDFASTYAAYRSGFKGYIGQSSCFWSDRQGHRYDAARMNKELAVYQVLGTPHPSFRCRAAIKSGLPKDTFHAVECVDIGDAWARSDAMERALDWLEKTVFLDARLIKFSQDTLSWHYRNKLIALEKAQSPFEKYELMEYLAAFAKKHNLVSRKEIRETTQGFEKELQTLARDDPVKKELAARMQFLVISQMDNRYLANDAKAHQVASAHEALAKQYEDTVYGKKAAVRAASLRIEFRF